MGLRVVAHFGGPTGGDLERGSNAAALALFTTDSGARASPCAAFTAESQSAAVGGALQMVPASGVYLQSIRLLAFLER